MRSPAPVLPPPPAAPPPQTSPPTSPAEERAEKTIAGILAALAAAAITMAAAGALVAAALAALAIPARAAHLVWTLYGRGVGAGMLRDWNQLAETHAARMRHLSALYLLGAGKRVEAALAAGTPEDQVMARERGYATAHARMQTARAEAVRRAAEAASVSVRATGKPLLRWVYGPSPAPCTPIAGVYCRDLDGMVFSAGRPPQGLLPGMRHANCRCRAEPVISAR